jgi:hypothetical protein
VDEPRTIYESQARRRKRRLRAAVLVGAAVVLALAALGAAAVWVVREGGKSDAAAASAPAASPSSRDAAPRLGALPRIVVHGGEAAAIRYELAAGSSPASAVTLVVTDAAGTRVKAQKLAGAVAGRRTSATVRLDLAPGRYTYSLTPGDGAAHETDIDGAADETSADGVAGETDAATAGETGAGAGATDETGAGAGSASAVLRVLPPLPPAFPGKKAVATAVTWAAGRDGEVAFAVVDTRGEAAGGYREHRPFQLASLSKAIMLVALLRKDPVPDAATEATLTKMITESDNGAAYTIFGRVGAKGMRAVARAAGMRDYHQGAGWVDTRASASDEARFFSILESIVPAKGRALARRLLSGVVTIQRWGIPAAAGPEGWTSYFKGGWLGLDNKLMVQAAWLEKGKKRWALAVMSEENPTRSYGWDTQKGVTGLLLGQEPTPAYLSVVLE